ncbi:MAG: DNA replication/repair protein RecF, partial [Christensenellales bacterium]
KNKKTIKINGIAIHRIGELMGELPCVFFSPDGLKLIKESPEDRRRFMDIAISQTSKTYFYMLGKYEKVLDQRNKLLKSTTNLESIKNSIFIWNEQLSDIGSKIIVSRINFLNALSPYAELAHQYLTNNDETLSLSYMGTTGENQEQIKKSLLSSLEKNLEKDFKLGFTSFGPHRDDIKILVNDIDIKAYGSQGQQKTTALSMKLAELEIIKNQTGKMPLLLLDDVFSELDPKRRQRLLKFCEKTQTLITCTDIDENDKFSKKIHIKNAKII